MPRSQIAVRKPPVFADDLPAPTPAETARYTHDMLISLRKLAMAHNQASLARLIEAAAAEALAVAKDAQGDRV